MIEFRTFTKREAILWQERHPPADKLSDLKIKRYENWKPDDIVAVVALDNDKIVGRNFVFPCRIFIQGKPIDCLTSGDLYVREEYRPKSIGLFIKMKMLRLGKPQIVGGVGGRMKEIYISWREYKQIDDSPVYQLPFDYRALIAYGRLRYYHAINNGAADSRMLLAYQLSSLLLANLNLLTSRASAIKILSVKDALERLMSVLDSSHFPVQIPWNLSKLKSGIQGHNPDYYAWVITIDSDTLNSRHLVSVYIKNREIRLLKGHKKMIKEAHLTEIFPPVDDRRLLRQVLAAITNKIRTMRLSTLHIYALNDPLIQICDELKLISLNSKSVFIAPNDMDDASAAIVANSKNWWCRAINEDQLKETIEESLNI